LALWRSLFSRRSFESSCVCEREVKYWTEKNVERLREEVTMEINEKSRRCDTFNFRNLARACGTKMIVEYRLFIFRAPCELVVNWAVGARILLKPAGGVNEKFT
jgi:hypothetical protein